MPSISNFILKFCGVSRLSDQQITCLLNSTKWNSVQVENNTLAYKYYNNQYYPYFRDFLANQINDFQHLEHAPENLSLQLSNDLFFTITKIELFIFTGGFTIYSLMVGTSKAQTSLADFSGLSAHLRNFDQPVKQEEIESTWLDFISTYLSLSVGKDSSYIRLLRGRDDFITTGSKLKVYQAIELDKEDARSETFRNETLFELATVAPIGAVRSGEHTYSPSSAYFEDIISQRIQIFQNWSALVLFDTFTVAGYNLLQEGFQTWENTYFKIYIFDLYTKYALSDYNSQGGDKNLLLKRRIPFNRFLHKYDVKHISYNFLPNLLHIKIRQALLIEDEVNELYRKIEETYNLQNERRTRIMNILLGVLAFLAILPGSLSDIIQLPGSIPKTSEILWTGCKALIIGIAAIVAFRKIR